MNYPFKAKRGLIIVFTTVFGPTGLGLQVWAYRYRFGPTGKAVFHLALDTGASDTMLSPVKLTAIGYDFADVPQVEVTMESGLVQMPGITLSRVEALGQKRLNFRVLAHALPPTSTIDGVLELDLGRAHLLTVNFRIGQLSLS